MPDSSPNPTTFRHFALSSGRPAWTVAAIVVLLALALALGISAFGNPGKEIEQSVRPATEGDRERISAHAATVLAMLRARYGDVKLARNEDDLRLLQRLHDDGALQSARDDELTSVGTVFGEVLASR